MRTISNLFCLLADFKEKHADRSNGGHDLLLIDIIADVERFLPKDLPSDSSNLDKQMLNLSMIASSLKRLGIYYG